MRPGLPTFDLIVATVGRTAEPAALLDSLERQTHCGFCVIVVDQNDDDRLGPILARHGSRMRVERVRSGKGLSRARNAGLALVSGDVVAFPDDDCTYPPDLLERIARHFADRPDLDGLTGRTADSQGRSAPRWSSSRRTLNRQGVWHGGNSASTFLRRETVEHVGSFDEGLGLGSGTPWSSGEEIDYLVRALELGARIDYDPEIVVVHELRQPNARARSAIGRRDGASVGYILRKHGYPARTVARMLVRPLGGVAVALARGSLGYARFQLETFRGRVMGYRSGRRR